METTSMLNNPGLTFALALATGMIAQALAYHLRIPGIVLLLGAGVALGPDGAGVIRPDTLGPALNILTGFAVAVILFEGGMSLKIQRLRRAQRPIRRLVLLGGLITITGAAITAHYIMGWVWGISILFGTLVMVTGPTVINPLLKRLKVKRSVATVLEAEGVLIDALGAVVAIVALETALGPSHGGPLIWGWHVISRLLFGAVTGALTAILLILLYRVRRLIPEGTENVFTLSIVLALFQGSNILVPESGIAAVTMAGIVIGNHSTYALRELHVFKEELTVMLIGMLFVLLAADVRIADVVGLGLPAVWLVLVLIFIVRPAAVFVGTAFSELLPKERLFIAWIGPRGIVAAAVASIFAVSFSNQGMSGGYELRALVFLVIAATVVFASLTGGLMAGLLGLRRPSNLGWVFMGANALARAMARLFKQDGQEVVFIDSNWDNSKEAENDCTKVIFGNGLQSRYLMRAEVDIRRGAIAVTSNDEVNYLFVQKVREETKEIELFSVLKNDTESLTVEMLHQTGASVAFGHNLDVDLWNRRFKNRQVHLQLWERMAETDGENGGKPLLARYQGTGLIAAVMRRNGKLSPVGDMIRFKGGDTVYFFIFVQESEKAGEYLRKEGWELIEGIDDEAFSTSVCHLS